MLVRYLIAVVGVLAIIAGLAGVKFKQISKLIAFGEAMAKSGPPPEVVGTAMSAEQKWQGTLSAVGSLSPARGVTVGNEVAGTVTAIKFESGQMVKQGQVLVELDTSVERAQLNSAIARRELAISNANRSRSLIEKGAIARAQYDSDESALRGSQADVGALQAQIERKTVRAAFAGRLGIRHVNLGQYLSPGTPITELQAIDQTYVDFTLPQANLPDVAVGQSVRVTIEGGGDPVDGKIAAIDPTLDNTTRTIKVRAAIANPGDKLRPGMFVNVAVILPSASSRVTIPATAVIHAAYGDSVFVVEDKVDEAGKPVAGADGKPAKVARQQFVRTGEARGDYIAVLDGVKPGQEVVIAGGFKVRNGAPVVVNNQVKLNPQLDPRPANR